MALTQLLVKAAVLVFVVSSMLSIGLAARAGDIVAPLRRPVWVLRALVANFVLAPLVVVAMVQWLPLDAGYGLGLMLLAFAAGSSGAEPKAAVMLIVTGVVGLLLLLAAAAWARRQGAQA